MLKFLRENKKMMIYGMLLTFFSAFGQTFFISMLMPDLSKTLNVSEATFGSIYGAITIASALSLVYIGKFADTLPVKQYTLFVVLLLGGSLLLTGFSYYPFLVILGLFGMRLAGQGLMPHTAATIISKSFERNRGKALSISSLGHPAGEAVVPFMLLGLLEWYGWRNSILVCGTLFVLIMLLFLYSVDFSTIKKTTQEDTFTGRKWSQWEVLKSKDFYLLAPGTFIVTFLTTAFILYQFLIAKEKGWNPEWIALSLTGFAISRAVLSLFSGFLIDYFGSRIWFPLYLFPFILGLILIYYFSGFWSVFTYMFLMGVTVGFGNTIKSTLQAEIFGVASIGAVRSLFSMVMVLSTALGPSLFAVLLNAGLTFNILIFISVILLLVVSVWNLQMVSSYSLRKARLRFSRR